MLREKYAYIWICARALELELAIENVRKHAQLAIIMQIEVAIARSVHVHVLFCGASCRAATLADEILGALPMRFALVCCCVARS